MVLTLADYPLLIPLELLYCTLFGRATEKCLDSKNSLQYTLSMAKRGRPKLGLAKRKILQIRVPPAIKTEIEQASQLSGKSLTSWAIQQLHEAAQKELEKNLAKTDNPS